MALSDIAIQLVLSAVASLLESLVEAILCPFGCSNAR